MDAFIAFLTAWGYVGMLVAAFIAGSVFPFSSEAVMVALMAAGLDAWQLMVYATVGNILGSMFNYGVGRMGRPEWIERYLHVKPEQMDKALRFMQGRGAWMGFFAFLPVLGSAISVALGLMRANLIITLVSISIGKALRYILLVYGAGLFV
ncbi:MAG: VTT domain-containing protein [Prevotella sp.]|nr:VTT domain-containing protein [Prevotella sp.]